MGRRHAARMGWTVTVTIMVLTGCGERSGAPNRPVAAQPTLQAANVSQAAVTAAASASPSLSPQAIPAVSPRAMGSAKEGKLTLVAATPERIDRLGAPSCYGLEEDYSIKADYEVRFETPEGIKRLTALKDIEIINPSPEQLPIQKIDADGMEFFYFVPRYTDCHSQEMYWFGVRDREAFPISFSIDGRTLAYMEKYPHNPPVLQGRDLVFKGGYGAGMDFVTEYRFRFDERQRAFVLASTKKIDPVTLR